MAVVIGATHISSGAPASSYDIDKEEGDGVAFRMRANSEVWQHIILYAVFFFFASAHAFPFFKAYFLYESLTNSLSPVGRGIGSYCLVLRTVQGRPAPGSSSSS